MVNYALLAGELLKKGAPWALELFDIGRKEKYVDQRMRLDREHLEGMRGALGEERFAALKAKAGKSCPTCAVPSAAKKEVGKATLALLRSTAQAYPNSPTEEERETYRSFVSSLITQFPCQVCVVGSLDYLEKKPLDFSSRSSLMSSMSQFSSHFSTLVNR